MRLIDMDPTNELYKLFKRKDKVKVIGEYPFYEKNPMFGVGRCSKCGGDISISGWNYCPTCGSPLGEWEAASCENCKHRCARKELVSCEDWELKIVK